MEPMTLGSPVGSPVQTPGTPGNTSAYLPSFLLGDAHTPAKVGLMSPHDISHLNMTNSNFTSPVSHHGIPDYRNNRQKAIFGNGTTLNSSQIGMETHSGGPPTRGLFDALDTSEASAPQVTSPNQSALNSYSNQSRIVMSPANNSLFLDSPLNFNPAESQGLLQWVTVFGFPLPALGTVLSHISSRVRVIDKHAAPQAHCNWIHLKCASEQEAQRALACNGSIVSGSIMIGVIPCTDEGVLLDSDKENRTKLSGSMRSMSAFNKTTQSSEFNTTPRTPRIQNARPLAVGYNQQFSAQSVKSPENVPQKATGLVSKAMEYVFRW